MKKTLIKNITFYLHLTSKVGMMEELNKFNGLQPP